MIVKFNKLGKLPNFRVGKNTPIIAARTFTICLLLLLVWALGRIAWIWVDTKSEVSFSPSAPNVSKVESYKINQLLSHNFFGAHKSVNSHLTKQSASANAPLTKLNLTLVGVVASDNPNYELAVIASSGAQQVYGLDEKIKNSQATLKQVFPDRVLLSNNGRDEILMLSGVKFEANKENNRTKRPSNSKPSRDQLASIKAEILKNPQQLLKYITLSQQRNEQGVVGYRVGPGSDNRLFVQAGLKAGDLVVSINGADLKNPAEMASVWQRLSDASEINLTVLRNGQEHNVLIGL